MTPYVTLLHMFRNANIPGTMKLFSARNINVKKCKKLFFVIAVITVTLSNIMYWRILANEAYYLHTDDASVYAHKNNEFRTSPFYKLKHPYMCSNLFENNFDGIKNSERTLTRKTLSDLEAYRIFPNCSQLFQKHYYPLETGTFIEANFPIAYVLLVNEHLEQIEILLNAIYAPQNIYCIHVDFKSAYIVHNAMEKIAKCLGNVFVASERIAVAHSGATMLRAQQSCLKELFYKNRVRKWVEWKYVIILQGHDFPLKTNAEIVEILSIHNGANDVELVHAPLNRFLHKYKPVMDVMGFPRHFEETNHTKPPPPHGLTIYKGSVATVLNPEIVQYSLESEIAHDLLDFFDDALMPDELFWSTLNHNEFLKIPGGYPGRCVNSVGYKTWITRFAVWKGYEHLHCNGTWRHSVCLFNCGDLPTLGRRPELFLNKFWMPFDPVAMDCVHELLFNRTYKKHTITDYRLDLNYYHSLSSVLYQKWRLQNPKENSTKFECVLCNTCIH